MPKKENSITLCCSTPSFPKHWSDSTINPLTIPLGWLCHWIAQWIRSSAHSVFLIQIADQSVIRIAS